MSTHQQFNVGAKAVICRANRILILQAKGEDFWELPGGRIDSGEQIADALQREITEELGCATMHIKEVVHAQIGQYPLGPTLRLLLIMFRVELVGEETLRLSDEHTAYRWIKPADLPSLRLPQPDRQAIENLFTTKR